MAAEVIVGLLPLTRLQLAAAVSPYYEQLFVQELIDRGVRVAGCHSPLVGRHLEQVLGLG